MIERKNRTVMASTALLLFLIPTAWSCMGIHQYDLYLEPETAGSVPRFDRILLVDEIRSYDMMHNQRIVVRKNNYRIRYLTFETWAKSPSDLIRDTIAHFYKSSGFFSKVIDEHSAIQPDLRMTVAIDALEIVRTDDGEWQAHLSLDFELIDPKNDRCILSHSFDRSKRMKPGDVKGFPDHISAILRDELLKFVRKIPL